MTAELTGKDNATVKKAVRLMSGAKERRESGLFIAEGARLCREAMENCGRISEVLYTKAALEKNVELVRALEEKAEKSYVITPDLARKISDTVTTQGIFCIGGVNRNTIDIGSLNPKGRYILLENVQDPSNIGAVFRTAEALGIDGALLSADCCDPWNPKAMRASMGAVFRLPFTVLEDAAAEMERQKKNGLRPLAAVPDRQAVSVTDIPSFDGAIMCVGNEGNGLTAELVSACRERVTIPMRGRAESLNAAAAASVLMWEMVRDC